MILTKKLRQNLLTAVTICIISVCVVFATAGAQILPEDEAQSAPASEKAPETQAVLGVHTGAPSFARAPQTRFVAAKLEAIAPALPKAAAPEGETAEAAPSVVQTASVSEEAPAQEAPAAEEAAADTAEPALPADTAETDISVFLPVHDGALAENATYLDTFIATAYCVTGTTSTGTQTTVGRTLAVNPGMIPYGSHVWLYLEDGTLVGDFIAEDTGSNMLEHPYVIDIYMGEDSYDTCILWGARRVLVYIEE